MNGFTLFDSFYQLFIVILFMILIVIIGYGIFKFLKVLRNLDKFITKKSREQKQNEYNDKK